MPIKHASHLIPNRDLVITAVGEQVVIEITTHGRDGDRTDRLWMSFVEATDVARQLLIAADAAITDAEG